MKNNKNAEYIAEELAQKLNNEVPFFEIQNWIKNLPELTSEKWSSIQKLVKVKVSKERIIEHDIEGLLEKHSLSDYKPKADPEFMNMLQSVRAELKEEGFYETLRPRPEGVRISLFKQYRLAAAAAVLALFAAAFLIFQNISASPEKAIFSENFDILDDRLTSELNEELEMSGFVKGEEKLLAKKEIMTFYNNRDFETVIEKAEAYFQRYAVILSTDKELQLYLAVSYMTTELMAQIQKAVPILTNLETDSGFEFQEDARWYLALCYVFENKLGKAVSLLEKLILNGQNPLKSKATDLKKQLK